MLSQALLGWIIVTFILLEIGLIAAAFYLHLRKYGMLDEIDRTMTYGKFNEVSYRKAEADLKTNGRIVILLSISTFASLAAFIAGALYEVPDLIVLDLVGFTVSLLALGKNLMVGGREKEWFTRFLENTSWIVKVNLGIQGCPFRKADAS